MLLAVICAKCSKAIEGLWTILVTVGCVSLSYISIEQHIYPLFNTKPFKVHSEQIKNV